MKQLRILVDNYTGPNPKFDPRKKVSPDNQHTINFARGTVITVADEAADDLLSIEVPADPNYVPEGHPSKTMPIVELVSPAA
jgi:hypothetical protein